MKNIFAKKGIHAFDIRKLEFADDQKNKENFKMSIRRNSAHSDKNFNNILNEEAEKNGFKVKIIEEKKQQLKKK